MDRAQVKDQLIGLFPPGSEKVIDWQDEPGDLVDAVAGVVKEVGTDLAEKLYIEVNPTTATDLIPRWESSFRLAGSDVALFGDLQARRNQVISRWREKGPPTLAKIRAVVGPLLDYADPSQLQIIETDRDVLRAMHTYPWVGSKTFTLPPALIKWVVRDDAKVSRAGAQVDITINAPDLAQIQLSLTAPDGTQQDVGPLFGRGSGVGTFRAFFPKLAGAAIRGTWQMLIYSYTGSGTITSAQLFVEGFGRDSLGNDGLSAAKFYWGVVAEPTKMGPRANLRAAAAAIKRINYATRLGVLIRRSIGSGALPVGQFAAIPDDPNTIPNLCIPG
jgi:hypothetical protein